jgi:curli production assembly/transport component CsgE
VRAILLVVSMALAGATRAQALDDPDIDVGALEERRLESLEQASGFIIDRTITNFGGEFVRVFSQAWRALPNTGELDVTVVERPTARYGSMVWVEHNQRPIARAFLYAGRTAAIRPIAVATAEYVAQKLADDVLANQLFDDPDLAKQGL